MNIGRLNISVKQPVVQTATVPNGAVGRLVSAAIVNRNFCDLLLTNPVTAIETGYGSEAFNLTSAEKDLILSVQNPATLADFAQQLIKNYNA